MRPAPRSEKIDFRVSPATKRLLQTAASAIDRSLSDFVVESALARAEETLPDRWRFGLDDERWARFQEALDAPPHPLPRLRELLDGPGPFDARGGE